MDAVLNTEWLNVSGRRGSQPAPINSRLKPEPPQQSESTVNHDKSIPSGTL
jgi:hypothetical protein